MNKDELEEKLIVGARIQLGEHFCKDSYGWIPGEVITLVLGSFEHDNGLYTQDDFCPAVWDEKQKDYDSIYHIFGNDLENFKDCVILPESEYINKATLTNK